MPHRSRRSRHDQFGRGARHRSGCPHVGQPAHLHRTSGHAGGHTAWYMGTLIRRRPGGPTQTARGQHRDGPACTTPADGGSGYRRSPPRGGRHPDRARGHLGLDRLSGRPPARRPRRLRHPGRPDLSRSGQLPTDVGCLRETGGEANRSSRNASQRRRTRPSGRRRTGPASSGQAPETDPRRLRWSSIDGPGPVVAGRVLRVRILRVRILPIMHRHVRVTSPRSRPGNRGAPLRVPR